MNNCCKKCEDRTPFFKKKICKKWVCNCLCHTPQPEITIDTPIGKIRGPVMTTPQTECGGCEDALKYGGTCGHHPPQPTKEYCEKCKNWKYGSNYSGCPCKCHLDNNDRYHHQKCLVCNEEIARSVERKVTEEEYKKIKYCYKHTPQPDCKHEKYTMLGGTEPVCANCGVDIKPPEKSDWEGCCGNCVGFSRQGKKKWLECRNANCLCHQSPEKSDKCENWETQLDYIFGKEFEGILIASSKKRFDMCENILKPNGKVKSFIRELLASHLPITEFKIK